VKKYNDIDELSDEEEGENIVDDEIDKGNDSDGMIKPSINKSYNTSFMGDMIASKGRNNAVNSSQISP
jgi:hypothetical protein